MPPALRYVGGVLLHKTRAAAAAADGEETQVIPYSLKEMLVANDAAALELGRGKRARTKAPCGAMKEVMWFMNRGWEDVGKAGQGRIHLRGADPVKLSNKRFTEQDQQGFREKLGLFPPWLGR